MAGVGSAVEVPAKESHKRLSFAKVRKAGEPALKKQAVATAPEQQHPLAGGIVLPKLNLLPLDGGVNGKEKMMAADGMTPRRGQRQMKVSSKLVFVFCICLCLCLGLGRCPCLCRCLCICLCLCLCLCPCVYLCLFLSLCFFLSLASAFVYVPVFVYVFVFYLVFFFVFTLLVLCLVCLYIRLWL